ncbi:hypothetical protein Tco_1045328, partial [Tanacetum coccineum]
SILLLVVIFSAERLVSAGSTMVLLVVILSAERLVSAGSTMVLLVVILSAGRLVSAGSTMILLVVILPAGCFVFAAAMDSAGSHHELGISPFADSDDSSSPSPVSTDHIPIDVLFEPTPGGINAFFLDSDEDEQIGLSRVAAEPDSDDEVLAEILFRGQYVSGAGVVVVDKLPDDEIVDPRVKVEPISESASSPPRSRSKHRGVRSDTSLWDRPVEDFLSSESESDDDIEDYVPPIPYGTFKDWEIVRSQLSDTYYHVYYQENRRQKSFFYLKELLPHVYREDLLLLRRRMNRYFRLNPDVDVGLDLWRDVNLLCQSLHSDDVEDFWRTQAGNCIPRALFMLTVPPSYCRDVVVAGNAVQTVQAGLRESYECLASVPIACTARQMVFSSPWLTATKESGSPLQTALVCYPKLDGYHFPYSLDEKWLVHSKRLMVKTFSNPLIVDNLLKIVWLSTHHIFLYGRVAESEQTYYSKLSQSDVCAVTVAKKLLGYSNSPYHVPEKLDLTGSCCLEMLLPSLILLFIEFMLFPLMLLWLLQFLLLVVLLLVTLYAAAAYFVPAARSYPLHREDLLETYVPAGSSSNVPADYVSAGHVLVPADRDRDQL